MIDKTRLYFVKGQHKNELVSMLAINVNINSEGDTDTIEFNDTNRERRFKGKVKETKKGFKFTSDSQTLTFTVATIKEYDKKWRPYVEGTVPTFRYEEDLHEFYRRRFL